MENDKHFFSTKMSQSDFKSLMDLQEGKQQLKNNIMNKLNLDPIADHVVVLPSKVEEKTATGIYIPDTAKQKSMKGTVVAAGKGRRTIAGELVPMQVEVGDTVFYSKSTGESITLEDEEYLIMKETSILARTKA